MSGRDRDTIMSQQVPSLTDARTLEKADLVNFSEILVGLVVI